MHFVIVSYTFPPSKEIGGRRWAKFSQQLAKKGHDVTVVCANNADNALWYKKEFEGINVVQLPKCYPEWLSGFTKSFREKFLYLLYTRIFTHFTKKNFFDKGYVWKNPMLNALEDIHRKKSIDVLVVTGAPFSLLYYGAEFKMRHKEIQYVGDFRDPWTWGSYYGMPTLSPSKKKFQELSEYETIKACDVVCSPTENMVDAFLNYQNVQVVTIPTNILFKNIKQHISVYSTTLYDALRFDVTNYVFKVDYCEDYTNEIINTGIANLIDIESNKIVYGNHKTEESSFYSSYNTELIFS